MAHSQRTPAGELLPWFSVSVSFCIGFKSLRDSGGQDQLSPGRCVARTDRPTRLHAMGKQVSPKKYLLPPEKREVDRLAEIAAVYCKDPA